VSIDSIRPWRQIQRRKSREINVGKVKIGGDNPISVQTMTNTDTSDSLQTLRQINDCAEAGAEIVRVSCPDEASTNSLKEICKFSEVPIVADIHFHYKRAIFLIPLSNNASGQGSLYFSNRSFSKLPALTPILIEQL
jgi:(E)-4-hydroxy-3-methylbut-2-enyl-diphosphate synthase